MSSNQYRVILTGELYPGYNRDSVLPALAEVFDTPIERLRGLFEGADHPVNQSLGADAALELQTRLERIGVRCRIERLATHKVELQLRREVLSTGGTAAAAAPQANFEAGRMRCPACGHQQLVSNRCDACGVVFAEYHRGVAQPRAAASANAAATVAPAPPAQPKLEGHRTDDVWRDFVDDNEPDERYYLSLFFGDRAEKYLKVCDRLMRGPRTRFGLGWNWAAVFSPFIWALYRKMWGWGVVIFITEIFLPLILIVLGSYQMPSEKLVYLGYLGMVANRLVWPLVLDFLYCRHARSSLQQLHMMSPNYAAEIDIATAGGVSNSSVMVGVALATVMAVFLWSLVDSVYDSSRQVVQQRVLDTTTPGGVSGAKSIDDVTGLTTADTAAQQNHWVGTRTRLRALGQKVNAWLAEHSAVTDTSQLNLFKLRQELSLASTELTDAWGGEVQYIPDTEGYRLISAGPDRLFGTADDIQYRRILAE